MVLVFFRELALKLVAISILCLIFSASISFSADIDASTLMIFNSKIKTASLTSSTVNITTGSAARLTISTLTLGAEMTNAQKSAIQTAIGLIIGQGPSESGDVMQWDPDLSEFVGMTAKPATTNILFFDPSGLFQTNLSDGRGVLGLSIGLEVQAHGDKLDQVQGGSATADSFLVGNGSLYTERTPAQARTSIGVGSVSTMANSAIIITGGSINGAAIGNLSESSAKFNNITATTSLSVTAILTASESGVTISNAIIASVDINGGAIDATDIGQSSASSGKFTAVTVDDLVINSSATIASVDINSGTIDGTTIGGSSPGNGTFGQINSTNSSTTQTISAKDLALTGDITGVVNGTASGTFAIQTMSANFANISTISGSVKVTNNVTATNFYGNGSALTGLPIGSSMVDADADTKIQVEESADDDTIRFDTAGSQAMVITATGSVGIGDPTPQEALTVVGNIEATGTTSGTTISATTLITGPTSSITTMNGTTLNVTDVNYSGAISGDGTGLVGVVHTATNETVNGIKTFGSILVLPASNPTTDNQAVRKGYLGSIATQAANNVSLSGGTIDGIAIGQTTASNAIFGVVTATTINGTIQTATQPNITSIGSASRLTATDFDGTNGNFTNINGTIQTAAQPQITSIGSASRLTATNFDGTNGNFTNITGTIQTANQPNITGIGTIGTLTVGTANGTNGNFTNITGTIQTAAQPQITSIGSASRLTATDFDGTNGSFTNITGTIQTATQPQITSIGSAARLTATDFDGTNGNFSTITGTLQTAAQPNITSVGTIGYLASTNIKVGTNHTITGAGASILGGNFNEAGGIFSSISNGQQNKIRPFSTYGVIGGGYFNEIGGIYDVISGGYQNYVTGTASTVSGGYQNTVTNDFIEPPYAFIGGGISNTAHNDFSVVVGGKNNSAGWSSVSVMPGGFIGGGENNSTLSSHTSIVGGYDNDIDGYSNYSAVAGGRNNDITGGTHSVIAGGKNNTITDGSAFIGGGQSNYVAGPNSVISGGYNNFVGNTKTAIAGGSHLELSGSGSFGFRGGTPSSQITRSGSSKAYFMEVALCVGGNNTDCQASMTSGETYADAHNTTNGDYAEFFHSDGSLKPGYIVGLDRETGLVRKYQPGDPLIGVASEKSGFKANGGIKNSNESTVSLVGLMGHLKIDLEQCETNGHVVLTKGDRRLVGFMTKDKRVYVNIDPATGYLRQEYANSLRTARKERKSLKRMIKNLSKRMKSIEADQ
jgi:hypothetical protein